MKNLLTPSQQALAANILSGLGVSPEENVPILEAEESFDSTNLVPGRVLAFNASQFAGNNPHEFLSNYAVRYQDPDLTSLDQVRQLISPDVMSNNSQFVEYAVYGFTDAFLSLDNLNDDIRGIGADFTTVRNPTKNLVTQRLPNRGLAVEVDEDEELLDPDWQQQKVAWLIGISDRTRLRRAVALFVAIATGVAKTWDATAGKDPDQDLLEELDAMMIRANTMIMGVTAASKRKRSHRAQNTAGGFASAGFSDEEIAGYLGLSSAMTVRSRYATAAATTSPIIGALVLLLTSMRGMSRFDYSNLKTFRAPTRRGGRRTVFVRQVGDKRWRIAVDEGAELTTVTSAIGAEVLTIS